MPESTKPKVINGLSFNISQPYREGHTLTALEADILNQTRSENIGNNVRQWIKDALEPEDGAAPKSEAEIQEYVAQFDANYVFRSRSEGTGRSRDPYETEARKIARELVKNHLANSGRKITVAPDGETEESWKDKVDAQIDKVASLDKVLAQARKNVDAKKKASDSLMAALEDMEV